MNINDLLTAISTVGFPIVCCLLLFYRMSKTEEHHKEEILQLKESIDNNTIITNKTLQALETIIKYIIPDRDVLVVKSKGK